MEKWVPVEKGLSPKGCLDLDPFKQGVLMIKLSKRGDSDTVTLITFFLPGQAF